VLNFWRQNPSGHMMLYIKKHLVGLNYYTCYSSK
jgi:hypothetical protein